MLVLDTIVFEKKLYMKALQVLTDDTIAVKILNKFAGPW